MLKIGIVGLGGISKKPIYHICVKLLMSNGTFRPEMKRD